MMGPRGDAAMKMLGALGGGAPGEGLPEEGAPPMMEEEAALGGEALEAGGIEDALAGVEAALSTVSEEQADEIRSHLEAIREVVAREPAGEAAPEEAMAEAPAAPELPDAGMTPSGFEEPMPS